MTNKEILQADMLDILFEHRNKMYGAYALRKTYHHRLGIALGAALSTVLLLILVSFLKKDDGRKGDLVNEDKTVKVTQIDIKKDKPKEPEPQRQKPKPQVAQVDYQPIVVGPDKDADTSLPDLNDIDNAQVGNTNRQGIPPGDIVAPVGESNGNNNNQSNATEQEPEFIKREIAPSFPGGEEAWIEFLRRFLQAPDDLEAGQRIVVTARFWVDVDGSVSRAEIVQSGGRSFDNEVLRVLRKMPKWQPAEQNGQKVAIVYTQSVTFLGVEE